MIGIPFPFGGKSSSMANPYVKEPRELVPVVWCAHAECHRAFAQALTRGGVCGARQDLSVFYPHIDYVVEKP